MEDRAVNSTPSPSGGRTLAGASPQRKLLIALPAALLCGVLLYLDLLAPMVRWGVVVFAAYAMVAVVEMIAGETLVSLARSWDTLAGWKKLLISIAVVVGVFAVFMGIAVGFMS